MSWGNNGNGNGGQFQRKIPEPGKGRLRKTQKKTQQSPDFSGMINIPPNPTGAPLYQAGIWYNGPKQMPDGRMLPESFSVIITPCDAQGNFLGAPQQTQFQGGGWQQPQQPPQQQQTYAQPAPGPQYAPGPTPPQNGGYAPAPGYQPPPQQPQTRPAWGGQPQGQAGPPQGAAAPSQPAQGGYRPADVPF